MANLKHVAKLQEGVEAWNAWRAQSPNVQPDLHKANLTGARLREANLGGGNLAWADLRRAHLNRANLGGANLSGANFGWADLSGANLGGADLVRADLGGAYLGKADLSRANLGGANLGDTNLGRANLSGANLSRAYLGGANLGRAHLGGADLGGADLSKADFGGAYLGGVNLGRVNLDGANLSGADLVGANLFGVNLGRADLGGADLRKVILHETIFANVDLTDVKGLESCVHRGPSTIDHRILMRSGQLPLSFLRGCGLPDTFIDYLPSLLNQPIQFYSCFISYSGKDENFVQRLYADLQNKGVRCWFAPEDLKIGDKIRTRIDEVIRIHDKLLLVLSQNSVASTWVEKEVETAFDKEIERKEPVLFPIRLDATVMESKTGWAADIRRSRHIGDFCKWKSHDEYQKGLDRLLRDLKIEEGK